MTIASPAVTLPTGPPGTTTLTDSADLFFGYYTTGSIVFTLTGPGGVVVTSQTDTVTGNGTYSASAPLPTTGTIAGTYTWTVHYVGDANNAADPETVIQVVNANNDSANLRQMQLATMPIVTNLSGQAISGAIEICRILWATRTASVARMLSVITSSLKGEAVTRPTAPPDSTPWLT